MGEIFVLSTLKKILYYKIIYKINIIKQSNIFFQYIFRLQEISEYFMISRILVKLKMY